MKELLTDYIKYNIWANERICKLLASLGPALLDKEVKSSFNSVRKTIYHIWGAEWIWYERLHGRNPTSFPEDDFKGDFNEFQLQFLQQSGKYFLYITNASEIKLESDLTHKNMRGDKFTNKISNILIHLMNHSTFHRGQIISMLRNLDVTEIPSTDFIAFVRERDKSK
jgi:uncharacterized damage-inducible protein DinB